MIIKNTIPFVDNTAALPQSPDPHLEQQGISSIMPNRQQLHIHNICITPRSRCCAGHNALIVHLLSKNEMSLIVGDIDTHHSKWDANTNDDEIGEQLADEIDTADYTILIENETKQLPTIEPDRMSTLHLKKLAHSAISPLTTIFNMSIST